MYDAPNFISELIKAANRIDRMPEATRACLLDISYETIRDMREEIGLPSYGQGQDIAIDMMTMARAVPAFTDHEIASALLEAATEIRSLHIATNERRPVMKKISAGGRYTFARKKPSADTPNHTI